MESVVLDIALGIMAILALVFANGFFVAAEFAIVTVRKTRIDQLIIDMEQGTNTVLNLMWDVFGERGASAVRTGQVAGAAPRAPNMPTQGTIISDTDTP